MRKFILTTALAGSFLALSACSGGADEAANNAEQDVAADSVTAATATVLDANTATVEQLTGVEGVTPELAETIVSGKPYASASALNAKLLETLKPDEAAQVLVGVFVPVSLNSASEDDIKLIPGMTEKMAHEFLEYRPYADMGVFDREIGKYVDEAEVARFRNYVTL